MKDHTQYADSLALYAMGGLDAPQEEAELKAHLGTCGDCRRELEALRADMALLALSTTGPQPPQRARERLLSAVAASPRKDRRVSEQVVFGRLRPRWLSLAPLAVTVVLAVFSLLLLRENLRMRRGYEKIVAELQDARTNQTQAQEVLAMLRDRNAVHMTLVSAQSPRPQPQVKTVYRPESGHLVLLASEMPQLPNDKVYEVWLLPANGSAPMPAGTFRPDSSGGFMMMHAMQTAGMEAKAFAITVEPSGGSLAPTMPIVMSPAG